MSVLSLLFFVCSLRTNIVLVVVFFTLIGVFGTLAGGYFILAGGFERNASSAATFIKVFFPSQKTALKLTLIVRPAVSALSSPHSPHGGICSLSFSKQSISHYVSPSVISAGGCSPWIDDGPWLESKETKFVLLLLRCKIWQGDDRNGWRADGRWSWEYQRIKCTTKFMC